MDLQRYLDKEIGLKNIEFKKSKKIKIDAIGLQQDLESCMCKILDAIEIKAKEEGKEYSLGDIE